MPVGYRVEVYYRELNRATVGRGGPGGGWFRRLSTSMMDAAKAEAPVRSAELKRSHRLRRQRGSNQWVQRFSVVNVADHAEYVHEGTTGPIRPTRGRKLVCDHPEQRASGRRHLDRRLLAQAHVAAERPGAHADQARGLALV